MASDILARLRGQPIQPFRWLDYGRIALICDLADRHLGVDGGLCRAARPGTGRRAIQRTNSIS